jgi:hypothetical protein
MRHSDLRVDSLILHHDRQDRSHRSGHACRPVLHSGSEVNPDVIHLEDIGGDPPAMGEPPSDRSSFGLPEPGSAVVDVALHALGVRATWCWPRTPGTVGRRGGSADPHVARSTVGQEVERISHRAAAAHQDEVDRAPPFAATVASPPLLAAVTEEDAQWRRPAGLHMAGVRAPPQRRPSGTDVGAQQLIGELG